MTVTRHFRRLLPAAAAVLAATGVGIALIIGASAIAVVPGLVVIAGAVGTYWDRRKHVHRRNALTVGKALLAQIVILPAAAISLLAILQDRILFVQLTASLLFTIAIALDVAIFLAVNPARQAKRD